MAEIDFCIPEVETYPDGRLSLQELYQQYGKLAEAGWYYEPIYWQKETFADGEEEVKFPIWGFTSPLKGEKTDKSLWVIGGIHGEEPASSNALAEEIETIMNLPSQGIPVVFLPVLNPSGYYRDWRYFNTRRNRYSGRSVGDADHLLANKIFPWRPRKKQPTSEAAGAVTAWILEKARTYQPFLVMDHHEDEVKWNLWWDWKNLYSYAYGAKEIMKPLAVQLRTMLSQHGFSMQSGGLTRFWQIINEDGFVLNSSDGSLDELLSTTTIFVNGKKEKRVSARAVLVFTVETIIDHNNHQLDLNQRIAAHRTIIQGYPKLWQSLIEQVTS